MASSFRTSFLGLATALLLLAATALPASEAAAAPRSAVPAAGGFRSVTVSGRGSTWVGRPSSTSGGGRTVVTGRVVTIGAPATTVTRGGTGSQAASSQPATPTAPTSRQIIIRRQTLVVGPDGRVQAPAAPAAPTAPPAPAAPPAPSDPGSLTSEERQLVDLVNAARRAAGLPSLTVDPRLVAAAREKAADLASRGEISHSSPRLGWPWDQWRRLGIAYLTGGENVAATSSVGRAHELFLASPGHRANVLRPQYTHVGVGVAAMSPYGLVVVEHFTWEP